MSERKYNIEEILDFECWSAADSDTFGHVADSLVNRFKECRAVECDALICNVRSLGGSR